MSGMKAFENGHEANTLWLAAKARLGRMAWLRHGVRAKLRWLYRSFGIHI
jgi:hypothetical protein